MAKNEAKAKSGRKPFRDISNGGNSSKPLKKKVPQNDESALDRLLLVHSDLSTFIHQIDELVVQALNLKTSSAEGWEEIESFTHVLSEMLSSLKPWAPRFQKALSLPSVKSENQLGQSSLSDTAGINECETNVVDSPHPSKVESLVSPSPLVSWRGDCTIERGRQLFMLTPLPMPKVLSSKRQGLTKSLFERVSSSTTITLPSLLADSGDTNHEMLEGSTFECGIVSTPIFGKRDGSMLVMTPRLKMSPPRSCVLLEPISESYHQENDKYKIRKSTPFPVGVQNFGGSESPDSSSNEAPENLALKYPELFGIQLTHKIGIGKKEVEESPDWFITASVLDQKTHLPSGKENDVQGGCHLTNKSGNQELLGSSLALVESTPLWKEPESTIRMGKRPGENTLKKELWTKFEAASTNGLHLNVSVFEETTEKGFLERLDEAWCDEAGSSAEGLR
ncbi:hypothetical protein CK203_100565 [Vitis vinifera]|uniref:Uncharacterized protein n=1 Tax=Vitis vinifera TaxID=29760 RepID=A0A438CZA0_VITVI|nr:hypothetical protein CK203_100565 [Vitis vinifera]